MVKAHAKTPLEFLYLETGAIPIRHVIASRRILYLQTLLKREEGELTKEVYLAQKVEPTKGYFYELVKNDFQMIGESFEEDTITATSVSAFKKQIKEKIRIAAFKYLQNKQMSHTKVSDIAYTRLETQKYITSPLFTDEEVSLLFAL